MNEFVVDSSVILALINEEPHALADLDELVRKHSIICAVNYVEVLSKLFDKKVAKGDQLEYLLKSVYCKHVYPPDDAINTLAAELSIYRRTHNLSIGDRYCLATAKQLQLPVYTADKVWEPLASKIGIHVVLIR